ncbi:RNA polymerase sigma factor [Planctomycetes bacterium Poly30]|uniref:RNA polymerase sigma factor n=1 Tax=Saltatorellus ferox TaxID=2528018 RepID=A0A518EL20_9BACT|nr:RNA polymerase sigma factor [Planctomycetes bacterium Poly30]
MEPESPSPTNDLFHLVYGELRSLARGALSAQRANHTLQPTALVHEVWLKLANRFTEPESRGHFLAVASKAMRQVLQDHARAQRADKRGQRAMGVEVDGAAGGVTDGATTESAVDLIALEDALSLLGELNERHARIAELRILGGLTMPEIAGEVGVSLRTVETDWTIARAWLRTKL